MKAYVDRTTRSPRNWMSFAYPEEEIAARLIGFLRQRHPARDRDALAVAALLATLLHLALLKWLALYSQAPASDERDVARLKFKLGDTMPGDQWAGLNLLKAPANPLGGD